MLPCLEHSRPRAVRQGYRWEIRSGAPLGVVVLAVGAPTATASYILARLLGGDAELMAAIVAATTLGALVTLPLVLSLPF